MIDGLSKSADVLCMAAGNAPLTCTEFHFIVCWLDNSDRRATDGVIETLADGQCLNRM